MTAAEARRDQHSIDPVVKARAEKFLLAKKAKAARLRSRPPRAKGPDREQRRDERRKRIADAREAVMVRAGARCEVCGRAGFILEAHHLLSGPLRRLEESPDTLLAICADCHRANHRNDPCTLRAIKETCVRLGIREGLKAVERRIAKVEETRRTPSVPITLVVRTP